MNTLKTYLASLNWPQVTLILGLACVAGACVTLAPVELRTPLVALLTAIAGALRSPSQS